MMQNRALMVACVLWLASACQKSEGGGAVVQDPVAYPIAAGVADEASGIADSHTNPGNAWVQQDSGNPPELILLSHKGQLVKKIPIRGLVNRDWEDVVVADGPQGGKKYVYLAETGDNNAVYGSYTIYRFEEPMATADSIRTADALRFRYPDGSHDAEAILVEPGTLDIYIITKRDAKSQLYKISYPYSSSSENTAVAAGQLPYNFVVSAALTPDGRGVAVKDYLSIYYYPRNTGEPISAVLAKNYTRLNYTPEQQGEALCFSNDGKSYFTLSEKVNAPVSLMVYPK